MTAKTTSNLPQLRFKGFEGGWQRSRLGDLFQITSAARVHKNEWTTSGVPFFRTSDVVSHFKGSENHKAFISHELYQELSAKVGRIKKGDILITGGGSIGIPYLVATDDPLYFKDADLLWLKIRKSVDSHYLYNFFCSKYFRQYLKSISHIGTIAHYTIEQAKTTPLVAPESLLEQSKIGTYLHNLSSLIQFYQIKHDKLVALKKAMLQKMFPQAGKAAPEIRFKGFEGDWGSSNLGEITENISNNSLSRTGLNYSGGHAKNIHYGDILVKFGEVLDAQRNDVPYINDNDIAQKLSVHALRDGDVVLADAAEDETVGKCTEIQNIGDQVVLAGLHTIALRPLIDFAPGYLGYFFNSNSYHDQLLPIMQGTKVLSISKTSIKDTLIKYPPSLKEQEKISSFFASLDTLVAKHEVQINKFKQLKASLVDKMFV